MKRLLTCGFLLSPLFLLPVLPVLHAGGKGDDPKEALQSLQEYIGGWKGNGTAEKNKGDIWKESASWSWRTTTSWPAC